MPRGERRAVDAVTIPPPPVSEDARFAVVHSDPRFKRFPKATARVEIDQRFASVLNDSKFKRKTVVDKRGRTTQKKEREDDLRRYYRLPQSEDAAAKAEEAEPRHKANASGEEDEAEEPQQTLRRGLRGSVSLSSSEDEDEEADDVGDIDEEISSDEEGVIARFVAGEEEQVDMIDRTRRLAVVDLDWERIRAVDIYAILRSFLPTGGSIRRVTVYPSDFGLQRMAEEEVHGPKAAFGEDCDSEEELDEERLRKYERDRLRYHYAIVEFDSKDMAASVYDQCDGLEFERSSTKLDLRFVPDDQSFTERTVRDTATEVPSGYVPVEYIAKALQQTRVQLTWDADDPDRKKVLRRKVTADQLKDEDFTAYLGSGSEDEVDGKVDDEPQRPHGKQGDAARLRSLLLGDAAASDGDDVIDEPASVYRKAGAVGGGEMVVSFGLGLEERMAAKRAKAAGDAPQETVWQAHLRERKAKRVAAKQATKAVPEDDAGFDDPFFTSVGGPSADIDTFGEETALDGAKASKKAKQKQKRDGKEKLDEGAEREERRRKAELELLLMDDAQLRAGQLPAQRIGRDKTATPGSEGRLSRKQVRAAAKAARREASDEETGLDTADPRFAALFTRPEFAIDPTDPRMKGMRSAGVIQAKRRATVSDAPETGDELTDAVRRLKRKAV